jgi:hypothetical protein
MRSGRISFNFFAGICILVGMGGCDWKDEKGFVEIKRSANLTSDDLLLLNDTELANLAQKDRLIIQERVGKASLQLKRGEKSQKLGDVDIRKDRVVTVTLTYVNASVRCTVQS